MHMNRMQEASMFNEGGQIAHLVFAGVRGGGKGGGGGGGADPMASKPLVLTDPVDGTTFTQETNPYLRALSMNMPQEAPAQDRLNEHIRQRQANEKAISDQAKIDKTTADTTARTDFNTRVSGAVGQERTALNNYFTSQGLDPTKYSNEIESAISRGQASIPDLSQNPITAFDPNLGASIINDITSGGRTRATNSFNQIFTPTYASDRLSYTADDPLISSILDEQFNPLAESIKASLARGTINDLGYKAASDLLGTKRTGAEADVQRLGQGVIDTDRLDVNNLISGGRTAASTLAPGGSFDPTSYQKQADELIGARIGSLGGDLRSKLGNTKYLDINELLSAAGSATGPTNLGVPADKGGAGGTDTAIDPAAIEAEKRRNTPRGLGNQGAF